MSFVADDVVKCVYLNTPHARVPWGFATSIARTRHGVWIEGVENDSRRISLDWLEVEIPQPASSSRPIEKLCKALRDRRTLCAARDGVPRRPEEDLCPLLRYLRVGAMG